MSVEIGSLVVRASFGAGPVREEGVSEERLEEAADRLRREFRDELRAAVEALERRLREG